RLRTCVCQLKVARDGISLTDHARRQFFRKHYPTACVLYSGMVPGGRRLFGFVARKNTNSQENTAVILCEIEEHQPAEAVVRFVCKYLVGR
uniref:PTB domain-containing protein n=1 Tax=Macrostomum lignano TaxID=282301 RepID=A0A1I8IFH8_9PLAT